MRQGAPDKLWIVLVKGSPTDLMKATQRRFYFDQMGSLTGKFGIAHTPALLVQQGDHLDIREVALPQTENGRETANEAHPSRVLETLRAWTRTGKEARRAPRRRMGKFWAMLAASLLGSAQVAQAQGSPTCHGHFPNPITDICWDCFFPLSIGGFDLWPSDKPDPSNPSLPVCLCGIRPGLSFGFWEPVRLIDVTTKPFCFPNLGGLTINPGMYVGNGHVSSASQKGGNTQMSAQYQAHYYVYPLFYLLELLGDFICFEQASFDLAYMTEIDPTWNDDTLAALVYPETVVFDFRWHRLPAPPIASPPPPRCRSTSSSGAQAAMARCTR
jgi:hypothetical protein